MKIRFAILSAIAATTLAAPAAITAMFIYNGHGYAIDNAGATWTAANTTANGMTGGSGGIPAGWSGAHLATIETAGENAQILAELASASVTTTASDGGGGIYAWLGANEPAEGSYQWNNAATTFWTGGSGGSATGGAYTNWGSYDFGGGPNFEPDNFSGPQNGNGGQDRVAFSLNGWPSGAPTPAQAGEWNDVNGGTNSLAFIIEFDVVPEPSSTMLLALGALASLARRRR